MYIGEIDNKICSATVVFCIPEDDRRDLSANLYEYWYHSEYYKDTVRINKETGVGKKITQMLDSNLHASKLYEYLEGVVFRRLKPSEIITIIEGAKQDAFREGREAKEREIRKVLGIY